MDAIMSFRLYRSLTANIAKHLFRSLAEPKVHPHPSSVLARVAAACVTGFCWHKPWRIAMPRKNPSLCALSTAFLQAAPVGGTRNFAHYDRFVFLASRFFFDRNGILQSKGACARLWAPLPFLRMVIRRGIRIIRHSKENPAGSSPSFTLNEGSLNFRGKFFAYI